MILDDIWCDLLVPVLFDFILLHLALPHSNVISLPRLLVMPDVVQ